MMHYYLKITLLVDEPIQLTVFSDAALAEAQDQLIKGLFSPASLEASIYVTRS